MTVAVIILSSPRKLLLAGLAVASTLSVQAETAKPLKVLEHSDVVSMYPADADTYAAYGIDVLAWGGKPTTEGLRAIGSGRFFGSVGMVTEFSRYYEFAGDRWEEGLCRDENGDPIKIHWLLDHQHKGIPYYFCCTNQQVFRDYIRERVRQTLADGAEGIHIDDHLGSAATLYHGGCHCDACTRLYESFVTNLEDKTVYSSEKQMWDAFQLQASREFMLEIRSMVKSANGQQLPVSANACLLFHPHSTDHAALDYFSAEIDQEAKSGHLSDLPVVAYRLAEALGRPLAATASGSDWAYILETGSDELVCNWIAQAYATGQFFMTPHRQWCHTPEKGTHWYDGPRELFAPLYQFIKANSARLDGYDTVADVVVLFDMRSYRNSNQLKKISQQLSENGINFRYAIIEDPMTAIPLDKELLLNARSVLIPDGTTISGELHDTLKEIKARGISIYHGTQHALDNIQPMVSIAGSDAQTDYRCFLRESDDRIMIHIVNRDPGSSPGDRSLHLDLKGLSGTILPQVMVYSYDAESPTGMIVEQGNVRLPPPALWTLVEIRKSNSQFRVTRG